MSVSLLISKYTVHRAMLKELETKGMKKNTHMLPQLRSMLYCSPTQYQMWTNIQEHVGLLLLPIIV